MKSLLLLLAVFAATAASAQTDSAQVLQEIVVSGKHITASGDRFIITPTREQRRIAHDAYSALSLLTIPGLAVDPIAKTVATHGTATTLCVNGRKVQADELSALDPADILRIDYYPAYCSDHPEATSVIDFRLRRRTTGGTAYAKLTQNPVTAEGNANAEVKQYVAGNEITAAIGASYNHFSTDGRAEALTTYTLGQRTVQKQEALSASSLHASGITARLAFLRSDSIGHFAATFNAQAYISRRHNRTLNDKAEQWTDELFTSSDARHRDNTSPAAQLYFEARRKRLVLRASVYGSLNTADAMRRYDAATGSNTDTHERYRYLRPTLFAAVPIGSHTPYVNASYTYDNAVSTQTDILTATASESSMTNKQTNIGVGDNISLFRKKLRLTMQLGLHTMTISDAAGSETLTNLTPLLRYNAAFNRQHTLRGSVQYNADTPTMSQRNETETVVDRCLVQRGTPALLTSHNIKAENTYTWSPRWGAVEVYTVFEHRTDAIYKHFAYDPERDIIVRSPRNGGNKNRVIVDLESSVNLVPRRLTALAVLEYAYQDEHCPDYQVERHMYAAFQAVYTGQSFGARLTYMTPTHYLAGATHQRVPAQLQLSLTYAAGPWHFVLDTSRPFFRATQTNTITSPVLTRTDATSIARQTYNVFHLTIAYRLRYGKRHQFTDTNIDTTERNAIDAVE